MSKDPFQILADEITLIRSEIEKLQRTSLNKDEAKALHDHVTASVDELRKAAPELHDMIDRKLTSAMAVVKDNTAIAADESAKRAVIDAHAESVKAAKMLLRDAEKARKQSWRTFGNFWAWMVASGALCACVALMGAVALDGWAEGTALRNYGEIECKVRGGVTLNLTDGRTFCGFDTGQ